MSPTTTDRLEISSRIKMYNTLLDKIDVNWKTDMSESYTPENKQTSVRFIAKQWASRQSLKVDKSSLRFSLTRNTNNKG